ncbi:MAG: hypothetical protein RL685_1097 [Pseudomonadota bacterium]|jgi:MYXO-CTERM domain-containing protein
MSKAHSVGKTHFFARHAGWLMFLALLGFAGSAAAQGRVVWKRTKLEELDKSWKIALEVHLNRAPDVAHVPVRFEFTPTVYYERALVDGRKEPVIRQIPLQNQQAVIESVDVSFLDPGSGKTASRTRFTFQVTRDRGFEAGQYQVKVTDARSDKELGGTTSLTLSGDNEVVDRRSVVFDDKPKDAKPKTEAAAPPAEKELSPEDDAFWAGGSRAPDGEKRSALPPPAHLQDKPGCGCRMAAPQSDSAGVALAALALVLVTRRARRAARATDGD